MLGRLKRKAARAAAVAGLVAGAGAEATAQGPPPPALDAAPAPRPEPPARAAEDRPGPISPRLTGADAVFIPRSPATILDPNTLPIDLNTALRIAGVQNPQLLIARQRVLVAEAARQLASAQLLPSINLGTNYDSHTGVLQQSNGNILSVQRSAVYVGAGANAVAAGTVNIPGVFLQGNPAVVIYGILTARQVVRQREFATIAERNQQFLRTTLAYSELLRAEGRRAVALQVRDEAKRVAELTTAYAEAGEGRAADAHRATTELARREADIQAAEGYVLTSSARLCNVLNLDPSVRLHPTDAWVVPAPIVPNPVPVSELIALALLNRPELGERRAAIREAMLALDGSRLLPFSPNLIVGFSAGGFGGGSNLVRPVFGGFGGRTDFDAIMYWTLQNLGVGNAAIINQAKANLGLTKFREIAVLDQVRADVAEAYAKTHARYAQIGTTEQAVRSGTSGFREDLLRIENTVAPAIEVTDSLRLLADARFGYLDAIVDYNRAQFELFVAMGQPPADSLAHPVPTEGIAPPDQPPTLGGRPLNPAPGAAGAPRAPAAAEPADLPPLPPQAAAPNPPLPAPSPARGVRLGMGR